MKSVGGAGLVIVGFLFLYLAITGKLDCFFTFVSCVTGASNPTSSGASGSSGGIDWGQVVNAGVKIATGSGNTTVSGGVQQVAPPPQPLHI